VIAPEDLLPRALALATAIAGQNRAMVQVARQDWAQTTGLAQAHQMHRQTAKDHGFSGVDSASLTANSAGLLPKP
jgi:hypothetical protein